jgi:hypothetical protein
MTPIIKIKLNTPLHKIKIFQQVETISLFYFGDILFSFTAVCHFNCYVAGVLGILGCSLDLCVAVYNLDTKLSKTFKFH